MKSFVYSACASALLALLVGCGGGGGSAVPGQPDPNPNPAEPSAPVVTDGASADCFNAVWTTPGTNYQLNYIAVNEAGEKLDSRSVSGKVTANQTFEWGNLGQTDPGLTEVDETTVFQVGTTETKERIRSYLLTQEKQLTNYGSIKDSFSLVGKDVPDRTDWIKIDPKVVDGRFLLDKDKPQNWTWKEIRRHFESGLPGSPLKDPERSITYTYLGQVTIEIPAGKFSSCKFKKLNRLVVDGIETAGQTTYEWLGKGNGVLLQFSGKTDEDVEYVAKLQADSRLNGKPF